jgi:hypothetical protein
MRAFMIALTGLLTGCYTAEKFHADFNEISCLKYEECQMLDFFGGTVESCTNYFQSFTDAAAADDPDWCAEFEREEGKQCITGWENITCDELEQGETPASCEGVCPEVEAEE